MPVSFINHTIILQSLVKPNNDVAENGKVRPNEDYADYKILPDGDTCILGLADGAGGYGVFASEWAEALVKQLPVKPMYSVTDIDSWLNTWWEDFYKKWENNIPAEETFLKNKFYKEGSASTLCALWLFAGKQDSPIWNYLCIGDSVIFRYNTTSGQLEVPVHLQTPAQWETLPNLLNWVNLETGDSQISVASGNLQPDDCWLMASDALAQWIWVQFLLAEGSEKSQLWLDEAKQLGGKLGRIIEVISKQEEQLSFSEWLDKLLQATQDETTFKQLLYDAYEQKQLLRDDYTLLVLYPSTMPTTVRVEEQMESEAIEVEFHTTFI